MGIDAIIRFTPPAPLSEQGLLALNQEITAALGHIGLYWSDGQDEGYATNRWPISRREYPLEEHPDDRWAEPGLYEINTYWRLFGIGYPRGPWPEISVVLSWLLANSEQFGTIYYGGDVDGGEPLTTKLMAELWAYAVEVEAGKVPGWGMLVTPAGDALLSNPPA